MQAVIENIYNKLKTKIIYPKTKFQAVFNDDGTRLDQELNAIKSESTVNLLNPTLQTQTVNGVTCTNNGDGTYNLNGTASAGIWFNFKSGQEVIQNKKYKYLAIPKTAINSILLAIDGVGYSDEKGEIIFESSNNLYTFNVFIPQGFVCNDIILKPMLTTNLDATYDDYVPYTGETGKLNGDVADIKENLSNFQFRDNNGTAEYRKSGADTWHPFSSERFFTTKQTLNQYTFYDTGISFDGVKSGTVQIITRQNNNNYVVYTHFAINNGEISYSDYAFMAGGSTPTIANYIYVKNEDGKLKFSQVFMGTAPDSQVIVCARY